MINFEPNNSPYTLTLTTSAVDRAPKLINHIVTYLYNDFALDVKNMNFWNRVGVYKKSLLEYLHKVCIHVKNGAKLKTISHQLGNLACLHGAVVLGTRIKVCF